MIIIGAEFRILKSDIVAECKLRRINYEDLAQITGYKVQTIRCFMMSENKNRNDSGAVAKALIEGLNLERKNSAYYVKLLDRIEERQKQIKEEKRERFKKIPAPYSKKRKEKK